jgi:hypothetical protein
MARPLFEPEGYIVRRLQSAEALDQPFGFERR